MGAQAFIYWGAQHRPIFIGVWGHRTLRIGVSSTNLYLLGCRGHLDFIYWGVGVQATIYWGAEGTALYGGAGHTPFIYWGGQDFIGIWGHRTLFIGVGVTSLYLWGCRAQGFIY